MLELAMYEFGKWMMIDVRRELARFVPDYSGRHPDPMRLGRADHEMSQFRRRYRRDNRAVGITRKDRVNRRISP